MADNIQLNSGTGGSVLMADEISSGIYVQRVKAMFGVDGSATDVSASNPMPVVQTGTPALPTGAATESSLAAAAASLAVIDDWDQSDRCAVNPISGQAGVAAGAGSVGATTQRMTLASDDPSVVSLASIDAKSVTERTADYDSGAGTVATKMVGIALPASGGPVAGGTSTNPLRVDPTGTTTQPVSDAGGSLTVDTGQLPSALGQTTMAASLPVVLASNQSVIPINDNGGSITIDGTVSAQQSGTWSVRTQDGSGNALASSTSAPAGTEQALITRNIPSGTQTVTVGSALPAGTNNIGDVDVLTVPSDPFGANADAASATGSISAKLRQIAANGIPITSLPSSTNTIEVVGDVAHDAPASGNPVLVAARANANEPTAASADGDATHLWADLYGRLVVLPGHPSPENPVSVNATASGNTTVIAAPGSGLRLYICKGSIVNGGSANVVVQLQDGAGGTARWAAELASEGGGALFDFGARGWALTANTLLNVNLGASGDVRVNVTEYYIAP